MIGHLITLLNTSVFNLDFVALDNLIKLIVLDLITLLVEKKVKNTDTLEFYSLVSKVNFYS